ncbi:two-component sensor histidine kinase, partial [Streptomyces sp. 15-116A]|nr:two-component sensor histidine kinase [Streptomyces sp. 15-116A]
GGAARSSRDPIAHRPSGAAPTADPTALPGNGARVVSRQASGERQDPPVAGGAGRPGADDGTARGSDAGPGRDSGAGTEPGRDGARAAGAAGRAEGYDRQGEASRGR